MHGVRTAFIAATAGLLSAFTLHSAPIEVVDLASSSAWTINGSAVTVPGNYRVGGTSIYRRDITIPSSATGRVVKVLFGSCNYGCEVYLGSTLITSHKNIDLPFEADLTGHVTAGQSYTLEVRAHDRSYYGDQIPQGCDWTRLAHGIGRYVKLVVLPEVYIKDVFVQPSVENDLLEYDVWVHNASSQSKTVSLESGLSSWNGDSWAYPSISSASATIAAGAVFKVRASVGWGLGPQSYWWPNMPFDENYEARLHNLLLSVKEGATELDTVIQRFGFVQYGEKEYYYTVNGVRMTNPSDGTAEAQFGYNAFSESSTFTTQCEESFKRYMRLGCNTNRTHSSIPTEHMMNVADEIGFMIIPESAIRGFEQSGIWDSATYCSDVYEMIVATRDHPSISRYSLENEYNAGNVAVEERLLIDAGYMADPTRPLVIEGGYGNTSERKNGIHTKGHAYNMLHYSNPRGVPLRRNIVGMGEYAWQDWEPNYCGNGDLMRQGDIGLEMRKMDWSYFAIWTVTNYWPNFLPGMSLACCSQHGNRTDGVDGWGSHEVDFLQRCLHPYVACDSAIDRFNACYSSDWPSTVPSTSSGETLNRRVYLFNGGLRGNAMRLIWETRWDSPTGSLAATEITDPVAIEPGFYKTVPVSFTVPSTSASASPIGVSLGEEVYKETRYYFDVSGRRLYFVLRSVLLPALKQFAVRPSTLEISGSGTFSGNVSVTVAEGTLPALSALGSESWFTASATGTGNSQVLSTTVNASGLATGTHTGQVTVSADGYEPVTYTVVARVEGTPAAASVVMTPWHMAVLPNQSAQFNAVLVDQFGEPIAGTLQWSASGGGSVNSSGLFTSNGTVGEYRIQATSGNATAAARAVVTQGTPLPADYLEEMLLLHSPTIYTSVPFTDNVEAIEEEIFSQTPCHGQDIVSGNRSYTWKYRYQSNGAWFTFCERNSFGYGSVIILNPTERTVKLTTSHVYGHDVYNNGEKVASYSGVVAFGEAHEASFTLPQGSNVFVFRHTALASPHASYKFTDQSNNALGGVSYYIDTCGYESATVAPTAAREKPAGVLCSVRKAGDQIHFDLNSTGKHTVAIITARGRVVKTLRGKGLAQYRLPLSEIGSGFFVVRAKSTEGRTMSTLVVW